MTSFLKKLFPLSIISMPVLMVLADFVSRGFPDIQAVGAIIWTIILLILVIYPIIQFIIFTVRNHYFLILLLFIALVVGDIFLAQDLRIINDESTQQLGCVLWHLEKPTLGFLTSCFLGYPTRGYYLFALPSIFFERSALTLSLFQHIFLLSGLAAFAVSVLKLVSGWRGMLLLFFGIIAGMSSRHFGYLYINFEQSLVPASLAFLYIAFLLQFLKDRKTTSLSLATTTAIVAAYTYTPALAITGIAIFFLLIILFESRTKVVAFHILLIASQLIASVLTRHDLRLVPSTTTEQHVQEKINILIEQVTKRYDNPFADSNILMTLIALFVLITIARFWKQKKTPTIAKDFFLRFAPLILILLTLWIISVLFVSVFSPGYASPAVEFALHRASLVLPIITGVVIWYISALELGSVWLVFPLFCIGIYAANNSINIAKSDLNSRTENPRYVLLQAIKELKDTNKPGDISSIFFQQSSLGNEFLSIMATDQYFQILTFYRSIQTCVIDEAYKNEDFLLLRIKDSGFCQEYKTVKCYDYNMTKKPNLELCQMTQKDSEVNDNQ